MADVQTNARAWTLVHAFTHGEPTLWAMVEEASADVVVELLRLLCHLLVSTGYDIDQSYVHHLAKAQGIQPSPEEPEPEPEGPTVDDQLDAWALVRALHHGDQEATEAILSVARPSLVGVLAGAVGGLIRRAGDDVDEVMDGLVSEALGYGQG